MRSREAYRRGEPPASGEAAERRADGGVPPSEKGGESTKTQRLARSYDTRRNVAYRSEGALLNQESEIQAMRARDRSPL